MTESGIMQVIGMEATDGASTIITGIMVATVISTTTGTTITTGAIIAIGAIITTAD
jgi:hypothetical protein